MILAHRTTSSHYGRREHHRGLDIEHAAPYLATMLLPASFYSSATVQLSWISSGLSQSAVECAAFVALNNCICDTPSIWTAYTYHGSPYHVAAFAVDLGVAVIAIGLAVLTYCCLPRQNQKMDQGKS